MSEDVSKFLLQVKELGDRRIEEDEARSRELEERILRERKEREARRAERARSISPQKSSPVNTPPPSAHVDLPASPGRLNLDESPILEPPTSSQTFPSSNTEEMASPGTFSGLASKENEFPTDSEDKQTAQTSPTRARGLSWQRRPNSQASERSRTRPLSVVAAENAARNTPPETPSATETIPRDQVASALPSKDPSWFRQTADRGATSAAYRKSQIEDSPTIDVSLTPAQPPGMLRAPSSEIAKEDTDSHPASPDVHSRLGSPLPLSPPQKLDPPSNDAQLEAESGLEQSPIMSPSSGRTSPSKLDRSGSPTKGMGGFVQSAMMKRSDSIKRWSVNSPTGVPRVDPVVSHRTGGGSRSRPTSLIRDPSVEASLKPSPGPEGEHQEEDMAEAEKPADPLKVEIKPLPNSPEQELSRATPTSPSKTMDSRRWSPTKSSWLESALNKPESPKRGHSPSKSQPSWMADLQKAKAEKAANSSTERSRSPTVSHKHQVSIGGLMRSSAPGTTTKPPPVGLGVLNIGTTVRPDDSGTTKDTQSPLTPGIKSPSLDRSLSKSPSIASKPKPEMPPKMDFRANLKPRQAPVTSNDENTENELKNVFNKLRKTTTQNYVAPDELKGNILKGKASLNSTGGPQKTERVDEFKEALVSKKKDFQAVQAEGRGVTRNDSTASETPIPEGIARRNTLRSNTLGQDAAASIRAAIADLPKPGIIPRRDSTQDSLSSKLAKFNGPGNSDLTAGSTSKVDLPSIPRRGSAQPIPISKDTNVPGRLKGKPSGGGLAGRFNPALAGLIARGPPSATPTSSGISASNSREGSEVNDNEAGSGPKLTHMTKGRARGPRRKAPTSTPAASSHESEETPSNNVPAERPASPEKSLDSASNPEANNVGKVEPAKPSPQPISPNLFTNPFIAAASEATKIPGSNKIHEQVAAFATQRRPRSPTKVSDEPKESTSQPPSPKKLDARRMSRFLDDATTQAVGKMGEPQVVKDVKGDDEMPSVAKPKPASDKPLVQDVPKSQPQSPPLNKTNMPLPDPLPLGSKKLPSNDVLSTSISPEPIKTPASIGRPLPAVPTPNGLEKALPPRPLPAEPMDTSKPLPNPGPRTPPRTSSPVRSPVRSPTKQSFEASTLLGDFFGPDRNRQSYNVDAAELLMHRPNVAPPRVQTLSAQLFQYSADGKKLPVAAHNERTLFEREMYLCSHTFKDESGKKVTEVYFWVGDDVPRSVVDDATQLIPHEARALGGKPIKFRQGKETPEFLQALGGIVIVQRGSGNKFDSLAPHILCGRRYQGHIVFDEVDFTPTALCSGFPYVVSTAGKCYLWKGKGSGVDELSCARLIGMDYAPSGEIEEIEDGHEPATFWDLFDVKSKPMSADHWRLKPNYDKYCCRLFCSNAASKQQIIEISPFSQVDLQPMNIYVLDAFFELYVIVGSRAQAQYASFHNALDFAQEYGILAAGMEDRPFVPFSTVVLEGIPRDMKSVFRKWRDAVSPTVTNVSTGLKRGRSLRVVPLNQALQALSD